MGWVRGWGAGLDEGLERLDGPTRPELLEECVLRHRLLHVRPGQGAPAEGGEEDARHGAEVALRVARVLDLG